MNHRLLAFLSLIVITVTSCTQTIVTTAGTAMISEGEKRVFLLLDIPPCDSPESYLFQHIHIAPTFEALRESPTSNIPPWAASVSTVQLIEGGRRERTHITIYSKGPEHVWGGIPGGQILYGSRRESSVGVYIEFLDDITATRNQKFSAHLSGSCKEPFVAPSIPRSITP